MPLSEDTRPEAVKLLKLIYGKKQREAVKGDEEEDAEGEEEEDEPCKKEKAMSKKTRKGKQGKAPKGDTSVTVDPKKVTADIQSLPHFLFFLNVLHRSYDIFCVA